MGANDGHGEGRSDVGRSIVGPNASHLGIQTVGDAGGTNGVGKVFRVHGWDWRDVNFEVGYWSSVEKAVVGAVDYFVGTRGYDRELLMLQG